ncbi:MAG TPA: hypothetical protein VM077_02880 [Candidatus Limnocylindrales bacterium]|nr:hypothetical protein [Candidatus Limnocylindrales bacterium]
MDPASLSNLDPKLRETYERVMGATTPAAGTPPPAPDATTTPSTGEPGVTQTVTTPPAENIPATQPTPDGLSSTMTSSVLENSAPSEQPQTVTINQPLPAGNASGIISQPHGHSGLIKVLYYLGAAVFFVIYVFFWMKIFNISLPF